MQQIRMLLLFLYCNLRLHFSLFDEMMHLECVNIVFACISSSLLSDYNTKH